MTVESEFILWVVAWFVVIAPLKAIRDIIDFEGHFEKSIFTRLPKKVQDFLRDRNADAPSAFDGWHIADGAILTINMIFIFYWGNKLIFQFNWLFVAAGAVVFWFLFYQYFNSLFHHFFKKKGQRDWLTRYWYLRWLVKSGDRYY